MNWNLQNSYTQLPNELFSHQVLKPVSQAKLVFFNHLLARELGLPDYNEAQHLPIIAGNVKSRESTPIAQAYAGHQFGGFVKLGDGRAVLLGEVVTADKLRFDIQLKGSGPTAYARRGDGRAALGPMLREYLISEAMYYLGVPTTRSLAVVATGDVVYRERPLPGAVLTRVAASHIRVGTFEYAASLKEVSILKALTDYTISRHYPQIDLKSDDAYMRFLQGVCERQADLIAKWMQFGFIHGVMNTDNMAISGETIDYGPCAFMDTFDSDTVFSSIDAQGRYRYSQQPNIALWNLQRLAECLLPLSNKEHAAAVEDLRQTLGSFIARFHQSWSSAMGSKLGMPEISADDADIHEQWLDLLQEQQADFTFAHRALSFATLPAYPLFQSERFKEWYKRWTQMVCRDGRSLEEVFKGMQSVNPSVIPRNHLVEQALAAAVDGDLKPMNEFLDVLKRPFSSDPKTSLYTEPPQGDQSGYQTFCGT